MAILFSALLGVVAATLPQAALGQLVIPTVDPCSAIAGKKYSAPALVRECFSHFPFNNTVRNNILDVVSKTINFHTSVNYQLQAPEPFADTHTDLVAELNRMRTAEYRTDFDFHLDISQQMKRLNDGHAAYLNYCYDAAYVSYLPFPLVTLNDGSNVQNIHIAPEAFDVASKEFQDYIQTWQTSSGLDFKKFSGAKVLSIDNQDPWTVVSASADNAGGYQAKSTRQNGFFSSYTRSGPEFTYRMGDFAAVPLPLKDSATLSVQVKGESAPQNITVPYVARFGSSTNNFTDAASYWKANCVAIATTNGVDYYAPTAQSFGGPRRFDPPAGTNPKEKLSYFIDQGAIYDISLPPKLSPSIPPLSSAGPAFFYVLPDNKTAVLALGSFSGLDYNTFFSTLKNGIQNFVDKNATHLIVDITNNGGGYVCVANFLHRLLSGPDPKVDIQAGLDTKVRSSPLAQTIVKQIISRGPGFDPANNTLYKPSNWKGADSINYFAPNYDWLDPDVKEVVNGRSDAFSQRLGEDCHPYPLDPLPFRPFPLENVAILGNGRCASSCSLFSINMKVRHGVKTVVVGGKQNTDQQYCGIVGGQSTSFTAIDSDIKTLQLKNHPDAPPDFITDSYQGITWRLGFGLANTQQPEEWASHPADLNMPFTAETVNNPQALWIDAATRLWGKPSN